MGFLIVLVVSFFTVWVALMILIVVVGMAIWGICFIAAKEILWNKELTGCC